MVHRVALIIGGVGAAAVLALAVVLGGFTSVVTGSADATVADQLVDDLALESGSDGTSGKVKAVVDTIYVEDSSGPGGSRNASPEASPDSSPEPTASPSGDDNRGRRSDGRRGDDNGRGDRHDDDGHGDRHDDDDDHDDHDGHHDDDHDDDDGDRSGHRDRDDHDRDDD